MVSEVFHLPVNFFTLRYIALTSVEPVSSRSGWDVKFGRPHFSPVQSPWPQLRADVSAGGPRIMVLSTLVHGCMDLSQFRRFSIKLTKFSINFI